MLCILTLTFYEGGKKTKNKSPLPFGYKLEHGETEGCETEERFGNQSLST